MNHDISPALVDALTEATLTRQGKSVSNGEVQFLCPAHEDRNPSAYWNPEKAVWNCFACNESGGAVDLARRLDIDPAAYRNGSRPAPPTRQTVERPQEAPAVKLPTNEALTKFRQVLATSTAQRPRQAREWLAGLGIDPEAIGWGYDDKRILIPVTDPVTGDLVDVRRYAGGPLRLDDKTSKMLPWQTGAGSAKPYRHSVETAGQPVVWTEGELDCEALRARGILAVSNTNGAPSAAKVAKELPDEVLPARVTILFDHDNGGRDGAAALAKALTARGVDVAIASWPEDSPKGFDPCDAIAAGWSDDRLRAVIDAAVTVDRQGRTSSSTSTEEPSSSTSTEEEQPEEAVDLAALAAFVQQVQEADPDDRPAMIISALTDGTVETIAAMLNHDPGTVEAYLLTLNAAMPHGTKGHIAALRKAVRGQRQAQASAASTSGPNQSVRLLGLVENSGAEPVRDPTSGLWLVAPEAGHHDLLPIGERSPDLHGWLRRLWHDAYPTSIPSSTSLSDAAGMLAARAQVGPVRRVWVRAARPTPDQIIVDLGWPDRRVAVVTPDGWAIEPCPAGCLFRRTSYAGALPNPDPAGDLIDLAAMLATRTDDWKQVIAWLLAALRGGATEYPILLPTGEPGAGKTTMIRLLRSLVDPVSSQFGGVTAAPRDADALFAMATASHVVSLDNLSGITAEMSDIICGIATGTDAARRTFYQEYGESRVSLCRPQIMAGVSDVANRPDLLDRALPVLLHPLPEQQDENAEQDGDAEDDSLTKDTETLIAEFAALAPGAVGGLLTATSAAMRGAATARQSGWRMVSTDRWVQAAEDGGAMPWKAGDWRSTIGKAIKTASTTALEASPIVGPLRDLAGDHSDEPWTGSATDLLGELVKRAPDHVRNQRAWPGSAATLARRLVELTQPLAAAGVHLKQRRAGTSRTWSVKSTATEDADSE